MAKKTKADLEKELAEMKIKLEALEGISTGHTVQNCHITVESSKSDLAVARAVEEGMKALQQINKKPTYGLYLES